MTSVKAAAHKDATPVTRSTTLLRLYISGAAPNSIRAISNLKALRQEVLHDDVQLDIVDVLQEPQRALSDGVLVTPTLIKVHPLPVLRVIGDLSQNVVIDLLRAEESDM